MRSSLAFLILLNITAGRALAAPAPRAEMRGLWVVRTALVSPQAVDAVVEQAQAAGFNALFVQVRGRGDAFYNSSLVPRSLLLQGQPVRFDPLARVLERARSRGLEIHAWVNVLLAAPFYQPLPAGHVVARHPEWVMAPRAAARRALVAAADNLLDVVREGSRFDPDVEGFYLSPSAAGVADHLVDVVRELVERYRVQGVHLDFIRYPGAEYDYSRAALTSFRGSDSGDLLAAPWKDPDGWSAYRREALSALAERLGQAVRSQRKGIVVSAAVVPDEAQALHNKFQDWPQWAARGVLDAVCPMTYTPDSEIFRRQVQEARLRVGAGRALWAGVGAYRLPTDSIIEKIALAREAGASGILLFSHESLGSLDLSRLRKEGFASAVTIAAPAGSRSERARPR